MSVLEIVQKLLIAGFEAEADYLAFHVLLCLVPAFFIAGAIQELTSPAWIMRYLGPRTPKWKSYPIAALSGLLVAVCSCTILPLFAGIWKKGAGLGPAVTFLYAGPAVNLLALTYTGTLIGMDIALYRAFFSVVFAIAIGLIMVFVFPEGEKDDNGSYQSAFDEKNTQSAGPIIGLLILILLGGTTPYTRIIGVSSDTDFLIKNVVVAILTVVLLIYILLFMPKNEREDWLRGTWQFIKQIFPLLIIGVFFAGMAREIIPKDVITSIAGKNSLSGNTLGVLFGVFMYFPTLIEVPIAKLFLEKGMAKGPLLAYLLADPVLSIQSILVTSKLMGSKRNGVYVGLTAIFSILAGLLIGILLGEGIFLF
ncbi:MAG: permease [Candidatus Heimdallarchaeota archaeon]|nr:permease [Candidatus Heimdallarchaeota archaeon]MCK5047791.1 permease [Candidatus Heimdallarchaeota archaeon]